MAATAAAGAGARPSSRFVLELDVMRGCAAVLMILNHAGYQLLAPDDASNGVSGAAVFIGSFAPVLFFFASGFGMGLGRADGGRPPPMASTLWKALLLVLADQAAYWSHGAPFGLDFFSFIGLGMVCLTFVARTPHPVFVSAGIVVLSLALRFAIGPAARESLPALPLLDFALGIRGIDGVSYPFSPWIAYASGGFTLGCLYPAATRGRVAWPLAAASLGIAALGLGAWMEWRGSAPFRWGTMNATFFVLSVGLVAAAAVACRLLTVGFPRVARQLALGGVASFAFIPVHYALLHGMQPAVAPASQASFFAFCAVIVLLAWALAQGFARAAASRAVLERPTLAHAFFGVSLAAFLAAVASGTFATRPGAGFASTVAIQLMIAALLGFRQSSTAASRAQVRP